MLMVIKRKKQKILLNDNTNENQLLLMSPGLGTLNRFDFLVKYANRKFISRILLDELSITK